MQTLAAVLRVILDAFYCSWREVTGMHKCPGIGLKDGKCGVSDPTAYLLKSLSAISKLQTIACNASRYLEQL